jgi:O-antigen ligase
MSPTGKKIAFAVLLFAAVLVGYLVGIEKSFLAVGAIFAGAFIIILFSSPKMAIYAWLLTYPIVEGRISIDVGAFFPAVTLTRVLTFTILIYMIFEHRRGVRKDIRLTFSYPEVIISAFLVLMLISAYRSARTVENLQQVLDSFVIPGVLYYMSKTLFTSGRERKNLVIIFILLACYSSVLGLIQYFSGSSLGIGIVYTGIRRVTGPFGAAEIFGSAMATILPLALYYLYRTIEGGRRPVFILIAVLLILGGIIVSFFRTCWIALIIELIILAYLIPKKYRKATRFAVITLFAGFATGIQKAASVAKRLGQEESIWERVVYLQTAIRISLAHPILGVGYKGYRLHSPYYITTVGVPPYEALRIKEKIIYFKKKLAVHNSYLQVLADCGFLALGLFITILILFFRRILVLLRTAPEEGEAYFDKTWYICNLLVLLSFIIPLFFQSMLYYSAFTNIEFFMLMGIVASDYERMKRAQKSQVTR